MLFAIFGHLFTAIPISTTALKHSTLKQKLFIYFLYWQIIGCLKLSSLTNIKSQETRIILQLLSFNNRAGRREKNKKKTNPGKKTWNEMKTHLSGRWRVRRHQAVQLFEDIRKLSADKIIEINVCRFFNLLLLLYSRAACLKRKSCPSSVSGSLQY